MRVLVLGGTGFIGSWIVRQLVAAGHSVRVLHRGGGAPDALVAGADYGVGDAPFSQICAIEFAVGRGEPDCVIHVLAMTEADAVAAVSVLAGRTGRLVVLSSGDVYRAYGRFIRLEPGPVEPVPLDADRSALRERLFPYRKAGIAPATLAFDYDKIVVERAVRGGTVPWVILRLPKVYGAASNADLATVYGFASQPHWRWTHGYVENVAAGMKRRARGSADMLDQVRMAAG
jgi:nucleoside-diphosphate-sugar epimerase